MRKKHDEKKMEEDILIRGSWVGCGSKNNCKCLVTVHETASSSLKAKNDDADGGRSPASADRESEPTSASKKDKKEKDKNVMPYMGSFTPLHPATLSRN